MEEIGKINKGLTQDRGAPVRLGSVLKKGPQSRQGLHQEGNLITKGIQMIQKGSESRPGNLIKTGELD